MHTGRCGSLNSGGIQIPPPLMAIPYSRAKDMGPYFTVDRMTDTRANFSLAVGKNTDNLKSVNLKRATDIKSGVWFKNGKFPYQKCVCTPKEAYNRHSSDL